MSKAVTAPPIDIGSREWGMLLGVLQAHIPDREVWAFGSRAAWKAKEFSDLDLAIEGIEPLSLDVLSALSQDFEDLDFPFRVDVVDLASVSPEFKKRVEQNRVQIQRAATLSFVLLGEVSLKIGSGATPRGGKDVYLEAGPVAFIRSQNIYNDGFEEEGIVFIDWIQAQKLANVEVLKDDVLLNITGDSVARCCMAPIQYLPARVNQHVAIIRPDPQKLNPKFLRFFLITESQQERMLALASSGATRNALTKEMIESFSIPCPPIDTQDSVASVLSGIEDRIEILLRSNKTLEAIARAIFKSWFVDFDPVRAKAEGREPEGMDAATASLFPSEFQDSATGLIPKGWAYVPLETCIDFKEGPGIRNWQYTDAEDGVRFINIRCIQSGDLNVETASRVTNAEGNGKYAHFHLAEWDLVVSTSGTLGRCAIVRSEHLPLLLNTSVIRFRPIPPFQFSYLHGYLHSNAFLDELHAQATGSVQRNFGPIHLKRMKVLCPESPVLAAHESVVKPLFKRILLNRSLSDSLRSLRDTLLPRLISGKLRVAEAKKLVEFAL